MKHEKLAEILQRYGILNPDQVQRALDRQKLRGGRLGSHFLYYRFVTEEQLVRALGEQFGVPGVCLDGRRIPEDVTKRLPVDVVDEYQMLPFAWDAGTQTLHVAMADPSNAGALHHARRKGACTDIKPHIAVDALVRSAIAEHYHARGHELFVDQIIELPAIFDDEANKAAARPAEPGPAQPSPRVLMVSRTAFLRNFLVAIFEREGVELDLMSDPQQIATALQQGHYNHVLVAKDMEAQFEEWGRAGVFAPPRVEMSMFSSVSGSLLENPAPYRDVAGALIRSLQQMADLRATASGSAYRPSYAHVCEDLRNLATALGFRRLAIDGLQIAAHLLVPAAEEVDAARAGRGPAPRPAVGEVTHASAFAFADFARSLEIAQALQFPWNVEACLESFAYLTDVAHVRRDGNHKVSLAAQILALVWYRFAAFRSAEVSLEAVKIELRRQVGRLAATEVVDTYLRLLEQGADSNTAASLDPVLLVGSGNEVAKQLGVHLRYGGYRVVEVDDIDEARRLVSRITPAVVLVNHERHAARATELCRFVKDNTSALAYAFSAQAGPALVMELLDAGFDDAYVPPFNYNVLVTRIGKALEMRGRPGGRSERGFRGTLQELPFIDLVQALSGSQRTVRVQLQSASGESASFFMRHGQIVHAACGPAQGADAIYRIIRWRDQGAFATSPVKSFPPDNVSEPTDSMLFEGCRLLDEAR